ncbi:MAG: Thioredoxin [uncultured Lysobacter sp.]|uniref:Thioredoxin n=1 Tax=uncultured Lysobacter sp. TaxID=271060 RepID=A0A6J4KHR9_9GAMM|nr:MAG: Thioredoxin [uncultured Lysobacter sp.]
MTLRVTVALAVLLASTACDRGADAPAAPEATSAAAQSGASAAAPPPKADIPALDVTTLDGARYELATRRGKWVVVNFWATWCAPCLKEMPDLSALDARREDLEVVGLAYEEIEPADMQVFLKAHPVVYPVAIVDVAAPPAGFETPRGLPTTYLIRPDGRIAKKFLGPVTGADIEAEITRASGTAT